MDAKPWEESSVDMPLLVNNRQERLESVPEDMEPDCDLYSKGKASLFTTCFNGLNALSGVGILSTPYALASGGWWSIVFLLVIAISTFYTGLLIQKCMDAHPDIRTYPDIGGRAFGKMGRLMVSMFMYTELYLVATGFLILEGDNLNNIIPNVEFEIAGFQLGGKQSFIVIVALIILPSVWLDNLNILAYVSASGVLASAIILCSIFCVGAFGGVGFHEKGKPVNWSGVPTAFSLYGFCYCAHPVFPTLYTSMKNKRQFPNVLILCFISCTMCYALMAVFGYLMFGSKVESQITLNLPIDRLSSKVAIYTTLVNPIAKYALMVTPILNAVKSKFPYFYNKRPFNMAMGTMLVTSTVVVALAVPFFGYLMTLVGAFLSVTASIILPCLCYLKISGIYNKFGFELVFIGCIIVMGVVIAIFGTWTSIVQIIEHL